MKRLVVRLVLSVLMSVLCFSVAQAAITYPLQLSAHILPPYGCRLSDYVVQGMERLNLTVLQRDLRYSNYDFLVRMQVKQGTKIVISSTAGYTVKSGQLTRLNSANLFNGLTADITAQDKYKENGFCLNEGAYEFVFQAFDAKNTALPVSEPVYFHTYLSKALPPACVFPANGSCVDYKSAAVNFAWMEKSVSMPSNGKRYSLEVYEMPEGFDGTDRAENLAGASEPVYRKDDINGNVTVHTAPISAGMFIKGRTYVWRVRSYSADFGQADSRVSGHVENNGYSQYSAFKFGTCVDVEDVWKKKDQAAIGAVKYDSSKKPVLESVDTSGAVAVVEWLHEPEKFCGYVVEWNMADTALAPWGQKIVSEKDSFAYISGLSYGVDYIVRLRGVICNGSEEQAYSACADNVLSFRLEKREDAECGNPVPQVTSLVSLKEAMKEGDVLSANGHDVTVLTCEMNVSGSDTTFSGTGLVSYGFLKSFFNLTVKFDNVKINDRKELLQGMVYANTDLNNCLDLNLNRLANKGSAGSGPAQRQTAKFDEFSSADNIPENKAGLAGGTMYAWDADGNRVECGTLEDTSCASNNLFVDSRHGEVLFDNLEGMEWNPPFDREKRPFDRNLTFSDYYENLDGYSVPWIGVPEGGATKVKATLLQGASVNPNDVHFVLRTGSQSIRLNAKRIDGNSSVATYEVPVFADKAGDKGAYLELSAVVSTGEGACSQQLVLGVAKVYALKREHFNVRLVPFRRDEIENTKEIEEKLNKIYKPLGKTFTVKGEERFGDGADFDFLADGLNLLNESSFGVETEEMTMLKFAYDELRGFSKENVYLFVLPKANMDGVTGFMPRGKHVGYLFCGENETIDERTVAHELGHGLFTLEHAFDYIDGSPVGSTNNLMDYSDGTNLKVWQWNHMDTHGPVLPFFDDAEDAMANALVAFVQKIQTCLDGKDITFFKNVRECRNCGTWGYTVAIVRDAISLPREEAYAAFCVMSCFLESAKIPERFWNAERNDYYFKAVDDRVANLFVSMMDKLVFKGNGENPAANSVFSAISGTGKCQFALCCGAYNAVVDLLKDVTETGEMLTQDPQKMYEGFVEALNSLENVTFEAIGESLITNLKEFHGFGKSGFNQYKAAYSVGYDVVTAASFFVGIGEISAVAKGANAGKVVMASVKASARQAKQIASGAVSGAKQLLKKSDDILKATEKFSQNIRSVCNDVVSQVLEKGIDVKIDIKNLSSDLKSVVISCALNTLEFTKDAVNISKKVDDVSEILYVAAENIKVYNKATKETFDATVALSKNAVVLISPELMNCVLKYGAKLKNVDKFKKIFANASASDLKKLMNNPDLIDVYNKWMNTHPRITKMDVKMLENCRKLQKNGIDFTSLNPGFKSYQKVVETMSTFCEKYKGLIPESEWNKIMNVMLVKGKVSDIKKALAEGMEWTLRHLNKLGKIDGDLSFEFSVKFPQGLKYKGAAPKRVADLKVCPKGKTKDCTYFEFKSVKEVPPPPFNDQFAKDLLNDDVTNLSQLKWVFDGKKFPEGYDFKGKMKKAIEKMDMPKEALKKFGARTEDELKTAIINNFDNIFQVK